ncbi:MAG TPA: DNA gyrase inhibitor YacG [Magnetovibrio sp.]
MVKKAAKCPICTKPAVESYRPFCSKRCADIDLGKWLGEDYRIPTEEVPGADGPFGDDEV